LIVNPDRVDLHPNENVSFTIKGSDQYGHPFAVENVSWSAPGCIVGQDGQVSVGGKLGLYVVTARSGEVEAQAQVHVRDRKPDAKIDGPEHPGAKVVRCHASLAAARSGSF
jgi:hypothetical protein